MRTLLPVILISIFLIGCVQQATPTPTASPPVITAATPTPVDKSNFSNELSALAQAAENVTILEGELLGSFAEISDVKEKLYAYSAHLEDLEQEAPETIFLKQSVDAINYLLKSNEYYLGAVNTGNKRTGQNFTCNDITAYNLALDFEEKSIQEGNKAVQTLYSLEEKYPELANKSGTKVAGDLTAAFYDGMQESLNETRNFIKTNCG